MAVTTYTVLKEAYCKLFLHAAKHPHKVVNGVLLGKIESKGSASIVTIADAIPLLHHWTNLSPMMEIGLDLAFLHAEKEGLKVVGYYQACERVDDTTLDRVGEGVANKIKTKFDDAIAFVIDGQKLGTADVALVPYVSTSTDGWRPPTNETQPFFPESRFQLDSSSSLLEVAKLATQHDSRSNFYDFDDHLEDVTLDWLRNKVPTLQT